jgi:drug/metabolite transporter (DMT)-like permease
MVYVQMLVALAAGMIFFGDWPDLVSLGGSAIIILAGIFLWKRTNAPKMRRIV